MAIPGSKYLGAGNFLGINYSIWLMVVFAMVPYIVTTRLPFGRHVYAIGGNERAAELSGVRINHTKIIGLQHQRILCGDGWFDYRLTVGSCTSSHW